MRSLKQKVSRAESRDRRRTLSLKGKETLTISKELEAKLSQLEAQVGALLGEGSPQASTPLQVINFTSYGKKTEACMHEREIPIDRLTQIVST